MLENFDPSTIEDETVRRVVLYLLNRVESQDTKLQEKDEEIQRLRDEINRRKQRARETENKTEQSSH